MFIFSKWYKIKPKNKTKNLIVHVFYSPTVVVSDSPGVSLSAASGGHRSHTPEADMKHKMHQKSC